MDLIYCVEDDEGIRDLITYAVKSAGFEAEGFESASDFEKRLGERLPSMVLLDIMLPDKDGIAILKDIRNNDTTKNVPVIMITAKGTESDKVKGFEYGADDYVTKPFRIRELISRIKTILRRYGRRPDESNDFVIKNIRVDLKMAKVFRDGNPVELTAMEYRLLLTMINHKGQVLTRNQLLEGIWDVAGDFVNDNTLTVYIKRIREKLENDPAHPELIQTVRGMGYRFG